MAWYDVILDIAELAEKLKYYLQAWVNDTIKFWIDRLAATRVYVDSLYKKAFDYAKERVDEAFTYIENVKTELWNEAHNLSKRIDAVTTEIQDLIYKIVAGWITDAKNYATSIVADLSDKVDNWITDLRVEINRALDWIGNADVWFVLKFNEMKDTVTGWMVERFEDILDRVFE